MKTITILLALGLLELGAVTFAQDLGHKAAPQKGVHAITNARLLGKGDPITVVFENGRIVQLGGKAPDGAQVIDAKGKSIYPGFFSPYTNLGLTEMNAVRATNDSREVGDLNPEVRAAVAVNPDSTLLPVTRSNGILTFATFPRGGAIPGRASVMSMDGWTWEDMAIRADAGLVVGWPNPNPPPLTERQKRRRKEMGIEERGSKRLKRIRDAFSAARAWIAATDADANTPTDIRWQAMRSVIEGKRPVFFLANDYGQITSAIDFAVREKLKAVIVGGRDAMACVDLLKKHNVPVIVPTIHSFPRRNDSDINAIYELPAKLEKAGVLWSMGNGGFTGNERNLPYSAGRAAAFGLSRDAAVRSITINAAKILGVGDELGSIEKGKRATFFLCTGDPLDVRSSIDAAWIDGKLIDLNNKQRDLAKKYRAKEKQRNG